MSQNLLVNNVLKFFISEYFSSYPTAAHAMHNILFSSSSSTEWVKDENGLYVLKVYALMKNEEGDLQELDVTTLPIKKIPQFESFNKHFDPTLNIDMNSPAHIANRKYQNAMIDWANDNLDAIADLDFHFYGLEPRRFTFSYVSSSSAIMTMPKNVELIHPEWADEISRHILNVLSRVRGETGDSRDEYTFLESTKSNRYTHETLKICFEKIKKLNARKIVKQRNDIAHKLVTELLAEIKSEESA